MHGSSIASTCTPAILWPVGHISGCIVRGNATGEAPTHVLASSVVGVGGHTRGVRRDIQSYFDRHAAHTCALLLLHNGGTRTDILY